MRAVEYAALNAQSCLLIISGPDRVGKGWLGERLHKRLMASYVTLQKPMHLWDPEVDQVEKKLLQKMWLEQWWADMGWVLRTHQRAASSGTPSRIVVDRMLPDEVVYSHVFERDTYPTAHVEHLDQTLAWAGARLVVVVERDEEVLSKRWDEKSYNMKKLAFILADRFEEYARRTKMPSMVVNTRDDRVVEIVADWAMDPTVVPA